MSVLPDYSRQAKHDDETRAASRQSCARSARRFTALHGATGGRLADIGGGTGNYALALTHDGWDPVVVDRFRAMLARAARKGLEMALSADPGRLLRAAEQSQTSYFERLRRDHPRELQSGLAPAAQGHRRRPGLAAIRHGDSARVRRSP